MRQQCVCVCFVLFISVTFFICIRDANQNSVPGSGVTKKYCRQGPECLRTLGWRVGKGSFLQGTWSKTSCLLATSQGSVDVCFSFCLVKKFTLSECDIKQNMMM